MSELRDQHRQYMREYRATQKEKARINREQAISLMQGAEQLIIESQYRTALSAIRRMRQLLEDGIKL